MKKYIYVMMMVLVAGIGCQDDDDNFDPLLLHHDDENANAPALPVGEFEAAAHFTINDVRRHPNTELVAIDYFIEDLPAYAEVRISESNGSNVPGNITFSRDVTNQIIPFSWNRVNLGDAQPLGDGLWLSVFFDNTVDNLRFMGCDAGPGRANGDWLYDDFDGQWLSYQTRTGESINWNIRGVLQNR